MAETVLSALYTIYLLHNLFRTIIYASMNLYLVIVTQALHSGCINCHYIETLKCVSITVLLTYFLHIHVSLSCNKIQPIMREADYVKYMSIKLNGVHSQVPVVRVLYRRRKLSPNSI